MTLEGFLKTIQGTKANAQSQDVLAIIRQEDRGTEHCDSKSFYNAQEPGDIYSATAAPQVVLMSKTANSRSTLLGNATNFNNQKGHGNQKPNAPLSNS